MKMIMTSNCMKTQEVKKTWIHEYMEQEGEAKSSAKESVRMTMGNEFET